jgi:prepilin-type N-terminal cleavage/methylation domain-containing protein
MIAVLKAIIYNFSMMNKNFKSNRGFTLVEILISLGILSIISYGIMQLTDNANRSQKGLELKDNLRQVHQEVTELLSNQRNCFTSLNGKKKGDSVATLYRTSNTPVPYFFINQEIGRTNIFIESMTIKDIDLNGSDGSNAQAVLKVNYKKDMKKAIGASTSSKEIKINANICSLSIIQKPTLQLLQTSCIGANKKFIDGMKPWNGQYWGLCQDCSSVSSVTSPIATCQASGSMGGFDGDSNSAQMTCLSLGGVFDTSDSTCKFDGQQLSEYIQSQIANSVDTTPANCTGGQVQLAVVNGKIKITCTNSPTPTATPQVACTKCAVWDGSKPRAPGTYIGCKKEIGGITMINKKYFPHCRWEYACLLGSPSGCDTSSLFTTYSWHCKSGGNGPPCYIGIGYSTMAQCMSVANDSACTNGPSVTITNNN